MIEFEINVTEKEIKGSIAPDSEDRVIHINDLLPLTPLTYDLPLLPLLSSTPSRICMNQM